jgi:hypothetical protein
MFKLTKKQERALGRMKPNVAARRRKAMEAERDIVLSARMVQQLRRDDPELALDLYGPSLGQMARRK